MAKPIAILFLIRAMGARPLVIPFLILTENALPARLGSVRERAETPISPMYLILRGRMVVEITPSRGIDGLASKAMGRCK